MELHVDPLRARSLADARRGPGGGVQKRPAHSPTVEVITSKEERRYWTRAEKMRWILALNEPDANASDVARRAGVSTSLLYRWRQQLSAAGDGRAFVPVAVNAAAAERGPSSEARRGTMTITFSGSVRLTIEGAPDEATSSRVTDALVGHDHRRMIAFPSGVRVWLATGHTDMRCRFWLCSSERI